MNNQQYQNQQNHIDISYIMEISDGDLAVIKDIKDLFSQQVPCFIEEMIANIKSGNEYELKKVFHKAKSACLVLGIKVLTNKLQSFENSNLESKKTDDLLNFVDYFSSVSLLAIKELELLLGNSINK